MKSMVTVKKYWYHWLKKTGLIHLLNRMLNEDEFLSDGGIRALSKYHEANPYSVTIDGTKYDNSI